MSRRPRVLFVTAWYPSPSHRAAGIFVLEHARAAARHADVVIAHATGLDPDPHPSQDPGRAAPFVVEREMDPEFAAGFPTWRVRHGRGRLPFSGTLNQGRALAALHDAVVADGFAPDLVHAHVYPVALPAAVLALRRGLPLVVTEHSSAFSRGLVTPRELREVRWAFRQAERVLPVSRSLQGQLQACGIDARYEVLPNAVDTTLFAPPAASARAAREPGGEEPRPHGPRESRLLSVGMLLPIKGHDVLLRALAEPRLSGRAWVLDLVGDGAERAPLERLASDLGLAGRVRFHGLLAKSDVAARMREADLFVLSSRSENLPCVLVEALASGLPIVATRVGGVPEVVGPQEGVLVPPEDPLALAAALAAGMDRARGVDRAALASRARPFSREAIGARLDTVYRAALGW